MAKGKKIKPIGVFRVAPFNVQVAVFDNFAKLNSYHQKVIGGDPIEGVEIPSLGSCIMARGPSDAYFFYIFVSPDANKYTRIHECSHLMDFVHDHVGVPFCLDSTELRAYGLAEACYLLDEVLA
jgi:hypothetical protein